MLPGISSLDCLWCDLGIDPAARRLPDLPRDGLPLQRTPADTAATLDPPPDQRHRAVDDHLEQPDWSRLPVLVDYLARVLSRRARGDRLRGVAVSDRARRSSSASALADLASASLTAGDDARRAAGRRRQWPIRHGAAARYRTGRVGGPPRPRFPSPRRARAPAWPPSPRLFVSTRSPPAPRPAPPARHRGGAASPSPPPARPASRASASARSWSPFRRAATFARTVRQEMCDVTSSRERHALGDRPSARSASSIASLHVQRLPRDTRRSSRDSPSRRAPPAPGTRGARAARRPRVAGEHLHLACPARRAWAASASGRDPRGSRGSAR